MFCDNISGQIADDFKRKVSEIGGVCWYGVPNATDIWQPVDAGYAEHLKVQIKHEHFKWFDSEENAEKWYNIDNTFSASERRILLTHWIANAYNNLIDTRFDDFRYRLFQKTGCLLTADGSDDSLIQPEGLPNYKVPPPSLVDATTSASEIPMLQEVALDSIPDDPIRTIVMERRTKCLSILTRMETYNLICLTISIFDILDNFVSYLKIQEVFCCVTFCYVNSFIQCIFQDL